MPPALSEGTLDVVVGTHRILSKDVCVQGPRPRRRRRGATLRRGAEGEDQGRCETSVDVLSMSATPIPARSTSLCAGIRDLSVIETPPKDRLAIATHVVPVSDEVVREAVAAELERGGQVYVVHNRIERLDAWREKLAELAPRARVVVAHGQMSEASWSGPCGPSRRARPTSSWRRRSSRTGSTSPRRTRCSSTAPTSTASRSSTSSAAASGEATSPPPAGSSSRPARR